MSDWPLRKLGDVATVTAGTSAPQGDKYFDGGRFNFVRTQDVGRYGFTTSLIETKDRVNELAVREKRLKKARKGASVFPKSGASILTNSRAMLGCDSYIVSHLAIVDANKALLDDYYLHYFLRTVDFGEIAQSEEGYPSLRLSEISELDIPIPPIDEQRRIVARIEELTLRAEEARQLRQEAVAQIATQFFHIRRNIYQSLLSDFPAKPLGKCGKVMGGGTPSKKRDDYWHGDIPWVAPKEMKTFRITASSEQITETAISESSAKLIPAGSVLFVVRGMILARYVPVAVSEVPCAINQDMKAIVPAKEIMADYLAHMLWGVDDILQGMVETAGHGTKKLETPAWSNLEIPIPDTEKQKAVIDELTIFQERLAELELLQRETAQELEQFQSALLAKAFRGEL
jgi:type I restriction enzyme S subunit